MAIAIDATSSAAFVSSTNTTTVSHVCTGSNRMIMVGVTIADSAGVTVTGITYSGGALTKVDASAAGTNRRAELWYRIAPATGTNNVIVTLSGTPDQWFNVATASYSGVQQVAPEASGKTGVPNASPTATTSVSITTISDNSWLVACACDGNTLNPVIAAGSFFRLQVYNRTGNGYECYLLDSNGAKSPAGAYPIGYTHNNSGGSDIVGASMVAINVQSDTVTTSDSVLAGVGARTSDNVSVSDSVRARIGFINVQKNSSSWSNQNKS